MKANDTVINIKDLEQLFLDIYRIEGQPVLVLDYGGYKGKYGFYLLIGKGRIRTPTYGSIKELVMNISSKLEMGENLGGKP